MYCSRYYFGVRSLERERREERSVYALFARIALYFSRSHVLSKGEELISRAIHTRRERERRAKCFLLRVRVPLREEEDGRPRENDDSERRRINSRRRAAVLLRVLRLLLRRGW